jgi:hypothetical protein
MASYVEVPADAIEGLLKNKGFARTTQGHEVVYERCSTRDPNVRLKVYTSIRDGVNVARKCGADSIKVCCVYQSPTRTFGVGRFPHINRVGDTQAVLDRILEKILAAAKRGNEWIDQQGNCAGPVAQAPVIPQAAPVVEVPPSDDVPEFLR